jgi:hypothetical protein
MGRDDRRMGLGIVVTRHTKGKDLDRAAAQLAEGTRAGGSLPGCVRFSMPRLDEVTWLAPDELGSFDPDFMTVLLPEPFDGTDQGLFNLCREQLVAALEVHEAACEGGG